MTANKLDMNPGGIDRDMLVIGDTVGSPPVVGPVPFPANAVAGTVLARIRCATTDLTTPAAMPGSPVPAQLAIAGGAITKGAGAAVAGTTYEVTVVALTAEGQYPDSLRGSARLRFRAT